jgi:hypothetical protein
MLETGYLNGLMKQKQDQDHPILIRDFYCDPAGLVGCRKSIMMAEFVCKFSEIGVTRTPKW